MKEFEAQLTQIGLIVTAVFLVLLLVRTWWLWCGWEQRKGLRHAPFSAQLLGAFAAIGQVVLAFGLIFLLFVLQRGSFFMSLGLQNRDRVRP